MKTSWGLCRLLPFRKGDTAVAWWRDSAAALGLKMMEKTLRPGDGWDEVLASGRRDFEQARARTGLRVGPDLRALEIGCGMGRQTAAMAAYYGHVLGLDVSPALVAEAVTRRTAPNVRFDVSDGAALLPGAADAWDVVFSCEVFHHLEPATVAAYVRDAYRLLRPGGQLVFQVNVVPVRLRTRVSQLFRRVLHLCGKTTWRGWPTAPGFYRKCHPVPFLQRCLDEAGFRVERVLADRPRDTWFVATKPA